MEFNLDQSWVRLWMELLASHLPACRMHHLAAALTQCPHPRPRPRPRCSDELKGYLSTRFTLRSGDRPHLMKF